MKYWLYSDGNILGPYEPAELLAAPDFSEESLVCDEESINSSHDDWKPASQVPELSKMMEPLEATAEPLQSENIDETGFPSPEDEHQPPEEEHPGYGNEDSLFGTAGASIEENIATEGFDLYGQDNIPTQEEAPKTDSLFETPERENTETAVPEVGISETGIPEINILAENSHDATDTRPEVPSIDIPVEETASDISSFAEYYAANEKTEDNTAPKLENQDSALPQNSSTSELENILNSNEFTFEGYSPFHEDSIRGPEDAILTEPSPLINPIKDTYDLNTSSSGEDIPSIYGEEKKDEEGSSLNLHSELTKELESLSSIGNIPEETNNAGQSPESGDSISSIATGSDIPQVEVPDFQAEIAKEINGLSQKSNAKEELDTIRLEKDYILGQINMNELGQSDRKKNINNLIQTLRTNAHNQGGKSVFDDMPPDPEPPQPIPQQTGSKMSSVQLSGTSFEDGFVKDGDAIEAEIDDSDATAIKTNPSSGKKGPYSPTPYNVSDDGSGKPPIYYYEHKSEGGGPKYESSITKVSLSDDFRSGLIDFEPDDEDRVLNLLPQQAGGMVYDFTTLSGKPSKVSAARRKVAPAPAAAEIGFDSSDSRKVVQPAQKEKKETAKEKPAADTQKIKSVKSLKPVKESPKTAKATEGTDLEKSGIKSTRLTRSGRRRNPAISEHEIKRSSGGPLMQEVNHSKPAVVKEEKKQEVSDLASMSDEDRIKQETYEAILSGKDPAILEKKETNNEQDVAISWNQDFDAGNLLQAASIENIGKSSITSSFANSSNPFQAADIYSTPQENVLADDFLVDDSMDPAAVPDGVSGSFLDIMPTSQDDYSEGLDNFNDYYVDSVQNAAVSPYPDADVSEQQQEYANTEQSAETPEQNQQEEIQFEQFGQQFEIQENTAEQEQQPAIEPEPAPEIQHQEEQTETPKEKEPKIIKGIPASLSSIHRSMRTTNRKSDHEQEKLIDSDDTDWDNMPDFNVQLSPLESTHTVIGKDKDDKKENTENSSAVSSKPEEELPPALDLVKPVNTKKEEELPPALDIKISKSDDGANAGLQTFELNPSSVSIGKKDKPQPVEEPVIPAVQYYNPGEKSEVMQTVSVPVEDRGAGFMSSPRNNGAVAAGGTLSQVLNPRVNRNGGMSSSSDDGTSTVIIGGDTTRQRGGGGGNKMLVAALMAVCVLLVGVIAMFMLGGNKPGTTGTQVAASPYPSEPNPVTGNETEPDASDSGSENSAGNGNSLEQDQQPMIQEQQSEPAVQQNTEPEQPAVQPEKENEPMNTATPVTATDKTERALEIAKGYRLSGGRGTINSWFSNSFMSSTPSTGDEWSATPLHENIYVVQYRLPRSRQDPLIYQFEVDVAKNSLLRGINNNAIDLLDTGSSRTARAVPARNSYDSEAPRQIAKSDEDSSIFQKAKAKLTPKKKKKTYRKEPQIRQLPLPPAPKRKYSQSVPTGFEQPEEDSNEAFLKAMESDEDLF